MGLYAGTVAGDPYFVPNVYVFINAVRRGLRPVDIAFMGQTLILFTVGPITQFQSFY